MNIRQVFTLSIVAAFCLAGRARSDEGRYIQIGNIVYYDVYRTVPRVVTETASRQTTQTIYKAQVNTETKDVARTWWCPVTTYRPETVMVGKWNFFIEPYYETRLVPETRWVQHSDVVKMPVTTQKLVPETQTVQVPVTSQKVVYENVLVSRVMVSNSTPSTVLPAGTGPVPRPVPQSTPAPSNLQGFQPVQPSQIGGVARLNQDPPRYSTSPATTPTTR